jgi:surface carbohydrate biosynthesis protein
MNVYIELELFQREFSSKFLLAHFAVKNGFTVFIATRSELLTLAKKNKLQSGIFHLKDANETPELIENYKMLKDKNFIITGQDEEAGISYSDYNNFIDRRFPTGKAFNYIDRFYCWGKRDKEYLENRFKYKTIFLNTGGIRLDLLNKSFYEDTNKDDFLKKHNLRNYILFSSNISYPINYRRTADWLYAFISSDASAKVKEFQEKYFFEKLLRHTLNLNSIINLLRKLATNFKDIDFVIRPHPSESVEDWKKLIRYKYSNLHIIQNDTLANFIYNSEKIIHMGCTAALEAILLNRLPISYVKNNMLVNDPIDDFSWFNNLGKIEDTDEGVIDEIKKFKDSSNDQNILNIKNIDYRVTNFSDKSFSCQKIINDWNKFKSKIENKKTNIKQVSKLYRFLRSVKRYCKKKIFGNNSSANIKFPAFKEKELDELQKNFLVVDENFKNIKYQILDERILKIYE